MEIQQLRYMVALAHERHFQRAARRVHISQPTLSQQIQKLEKELGVYLFERSPRSVRLTAEGERFLPHAVSILQGVERAAGEMRELSHEIAGRLVVGVIPTIGPYLLPGVIRRLRESAPQLVLELHDLTTSVLLEHLQEGKIDLGVLSLPVAERGIASRILGREPFYLAVARRHRLARQARVTLKDLEHERLLVLQEGHCFRNQSLAYCKRSSDDPRIIFQGSSLSSVMQMAAAGEGATFVPAMAAQTRQNPELKFIPFAAPEPTRELGVVWRLTTPLNRAQSRFIEIVDEVVNAELKNQLRMKTR